ncbi:MAG: extracellular solute-binding protein [Spirochaetales bacterium]|nr:extracellular solute-binding protein [Spirochaetales bacterium]
MRKCVPSFVLCAILAFSATSMAFANGEKDVAESSATSELKISVFQGGFGREYWDLMAERFQEQTGIQTTVEASPNIAEMIRTDILSGNAPDFVFLQANEAVTKTLMADRQLVDLTDTIAPIKDKFVDGTFSMKSIAPYGDGRVYLTPFVSSTMGLWYNKTHFEENGIATPATWDEFFALDGASAERALFTYQGIYPGYLQCFLYSVFAASSENGKGMLDRLTSYDPTTLDDPGFRNALALLEKMNSEDLLLKGTVGMDHTMSQSEFLKGSALFIPCGSWIVNEMADAPKEDGFAYGMLPAPSLKPGMDRYISTKFEEMYIPSTAKNIENAKKFLLFLYEEENLIEQAKLTQGLPPMKNAVELIEPYVDPGVTASLRILEEDGVMPLGATFTPVNGMATNPEDYFWEQMGAIITGVKSPQKVVDELRPVFEEAQSLLAE